MDRRTFVAATGAAALGAAAGPVAAADPVLAGSGTQWSGGAAFTGGKGYVDAPLGQLHYREVGQGGRTPILLIHQTPIGMAEYVDIQPALARAGRRSIVSDNPGYGNSDPAPVGVTMAALADNLVPLLDRLKAPRVIVAGHHTGAAFAAAFAARHPGRTAGVVLHGVPLYNAQESAERLARPSDSPALKPDGSHLSEAYASIYNRIGGMPENTAGVTWAVLGQFRSAPHSPVYAAVFSNDMSKDLAAIRAPTLLLTDTGDVLHPNDLRAAALRPDFTLQEFSKEGSFALMRRPQLWVDTVLAFAKTHDL